MYTIGFTCDKQITVTQIKDDLSITIIFVIYNNNNKQASVRAQQP